MAKLEDLLQGLRAEDLPEKYADLKPILTAIDAAVTSLGNAFRNQVTLADNLYVERIDVNLSHGVAQTVKLKKLPRAGCVIGYSCGTDSSGTAHAFLFPPVASPTSTPGQAQILAYFRNNTAKRVSCSIYVAPDGVTSSKTPSATSDPILTGSAAGGDLSGTYPNPTVAKINGVALGSTIATSANMLLADGSSWVSRAMSGDATIGNTGVVALKNTGTAGTNTKVTTDAQGRVTALAAAALASADFANQGTTTTVLHGNAAGNPSFAAVSLTADITGTLAEGHGGTNQTTYTTGDLLYASAANTLSKLAAVATGSVLRSAGTSTAPAWYVPPVLIADTAAGQSISSGSATTIVYGSNVTDSDSAYNASTGVWTCPTGKGGYYEVTAACEFSVALTATDVEIGIYVAGSLKRLYQLPNPPLNQSLVVTAIVAVNAAQTVEAKVFQNAGSSKTLVASTALNYLTIKQVA